MAYEIGDPNHIEVHNALVADVQAQADRFSVDVTLPDTANLGDLGHTSDHNLIVDALAAIAAAPNPGTPAAIASGGTETTFVGDGTNGELGVTYKVHTFTANGSLIVSQSGLADALIVAGGGGGTDLTGNGAGGVIQTPLILSATTYTITVGAGGSQNNNGADSRIGSIVAVGGQSSGSPTRRGGSGKQGGTSATTDYTPGQGNPGAAGGSNAGGGGAGGPGNTTVGGGPGLVSYLSGVAVQYAQGGDSSDFAGKAPTTTPGSGSSHTQSNGVNGIVIIRYKA